MTFTREQAELLNSVANNRAFQEILKVLLEDEIKGLYEVLFAATLSNDQHLAVRTAGKVEAVATLPEILTNAARRTAHLTVQE